jgi:hypothetical protein
MRVIKRLSLAVLATFALYATGARADSTDSTGYALGGPDLFSAGGSIKYTVNGGIGTLSVYAPTLWDNQDPNVMDPVDFLNLKVTFDLLDSSNHPLTDPSKVKILSGSLSDTFNDGNGPIAHYDSTQIIPVNNFNFSGGDPYFSFLFSGNIGVNVLPQTDGVDMPADPSKGFLQGFDYGKGDFWNNPNEIDVGTVAVPLPKAGWTGASTLILLTLLACGKSAMRARRLSAPR